LIEVAVIDRVARFSINRPEKRNALNANTCRQLLDAFDRAEADPAVGAIMLRGNGTAFCAGMDLDEVLSADQNELTDLHERLFTVIQRARKPIVAGVRGAALAGGMGLAANAHIVIASPESRFGLTEIRIGLWPIVVFRAVSRAIGERRTTELSLTGRSIGADEALKFGLVAELAGDPKIKAFELAQKLAEFSPAAISTGLEYIDRIRGLGWKEAAPIGHRMRAELMATDDFTEGVRAFLEKRPPEWPSLKPSEPS
jgi:enoyl-CoA hydratase/carnithine racemase